ncbi:MAG: hypothetical protein DYG89_44235 [Caldilinea sp. CFX5]|nr:hypothetical protein [Caldilinea sp. CFX5]
MLPFAQFTSTDFSSHLNQPFKLEVESLPPILLQLRAVRNLAATENGQSNLRADEFFVVFNGPLRPLLPKQIYCLEHPTMGKIKLLFAPIGPNGASMQYQATVVAEARPNN